MLQHKLKITSLRSIVAQLDNFPGQQKGSSYLCGASVVHVGYDSTQRACFVCFLQRVLEREQGHSTLRFEPSVLKKMPWLLATQTSEYACCVLLRAMH